MTTTYNGQLDPRYYDQNQQGGGRIADRTAPLRKFYGTEEPSSKQRWVASGIVAKGGTFMQCDNAGFLVPHRGFKEKALITFLATLTVGNVVIIAGLTFTAGSSGATAANLVKAWSSIPSGTGYVGAAAMALAAGVTDAMGTFTAGTLTNYLTDEVTIGDITPNAVAFVSTGTDVDPANLTVTTNNEADLTIVDIILATQNFQKVEGVLAVDVDNTAAAAQAPIFNEGILYGDNDGRSFLRWLTDTSGSIANSEKVYNPVTNTYVTCTAYNTGCYGNTEAAKRAKERFVTGAEIGIYLFQAGANIGMESLTNALVGDPA